MHGWWAVSYVVLWLVVAALALLALALARQIGILELRLGPRGALEIDGEGPPLGEAPEPIDAVDAAGRTAAIGGPGTSQLLLFVSPDCPVCRDVIPSIGAAARIGRLAPLVISDGPAPHLDRAPAPVVVSEEAARAFGVPGTPYAVVLDDLGVVRAKGTVNSLEQLEGLVDTARRRLDESPAGANVH
ncbi:MAG: hypothetical protein ABR600_14060 [Actinomycetota bacterium]